MRGIAQFLIFLSGFNFFKMPKLSGPPKSLLINSPAHL